MCRLGTVVRPSLVVAATDEAAPEGAQERLGVVWRFAHRLKETSGKAPGAYQRESLPRLELGPHRSW